MKLPRDISGQGLAALLSKYGYETVRQTGSHLRIASNVRGHEHRVTVPMSRGLPVGTLNAILSDVGAYLGMDKALLAQTLFE